MSANLGKPIINHNEDESMPQVIQCVNNIESSNFCIIEAILVKIGAFLLTGSLYDMPKSEQLIYRPYGNEGITPREGDTIIIRSASQKKKRPSFDGSS